MDVDCTQTLKPLTQTCYHCGQTGHISRECDLHHDVYHMTLDEEDEFIPQINHDAAVASTAELMTHTGTSEGWCRASAHVTTTLQASQPSRVKPGTPSHFDGDRAQGCAFLMSCELYILLTQLDFINKQVCIHWALSYFKSRHAASFTKCILQQELRSGKMCFTSWNDFTEEFALMFCPENEATTALMQLESDRYYQGKQNVEVYINEFKDLIDLSSYTDPITIVLKFHKGLNSMTQDRIAESGMDRPSDTDFKG
jgi:hypothetical protein